MSSCGIFRRAQSGASFFPETGFATAFGATVFGVLGPSSCEVVVALPVRAQQRQHEEKLAEMQKELEEEGDKEKELYNKCNRFLL